MHLKSITVKGFKSFPDRVRLDFGPGVSVIVGPNGSGKSNITDAVLWALGEQSPLAVRGQTMQDVVFAGGHGVKGRSTAEVEVVIDNADGRLHSEFSEISIGRRLDRSGDGAYRLNGARCRLVDVLEVLSDSGLGKEMHSVISQGKVEAIVHSKPGDRTAMIEEAAGLTKHRKRRHRVELKLRRTQDNLDRALDVEREARSRLRPLKRQAEAAELHARLERQTLETRGTLVAEELRAARAELAVADAAATAARAARDGLEARLLEVAREREQVERAFTEQGREREQLSARLFAARSAAERLSVRGESAEQGLRSVQARIERSRRAVQSLAEREREDSGASGSRLAELEQELSRLESEREQRLESELAELEAERSSAEARGSALQSGIADLERRLEDSAGEARSARSMQAAAGARTTEAARTEAALELELQRVEERLRLSAPRERGLVLGDLVHAEPGYEGALAAALGGRLRARIVSSAAEGETVVEREREGGRALVGGAEAEIHVHRGPPLPGAQRLLDFVESRPAANALVRALLGNAWVVDRIADVPPGFAGIAVTRAGTAYHGAGREVRRHPAGTGERALAERNRQVELRTELERVVTRRRAADQEMEGAARAVADAEQRRELIEGELRDLRRERTEALESMRRAAWLIGQRRAHGGGPGDARRAELSGEIAAERRIAERLEQERAERASRRLRLEAQLERDEALVPVAERVIAAIERAGAAVGARHTDLERELAAGESAGEHAATELRGLAAREYELQGGLREAGEALTGEEVRVAHDRDREESRSQELAAIGERLGVDIVPAAEALPEAEGAELAARLERLDRRRERLGPVNPLAEREYQEALAHVEELEVQRKDLEGALSELRSLIRETDRRIRAAFDETFSAAAQNFEQVVERLFPGGRGRLRRVSAPRPREVLGGEDAGVAAEQPEGTAPFGGTAPEQTGADSAGALRAGGDGLPPGGIRDPESDGSTAGVEIEVTPAGKTTRRLSLLSGGEKSLVALAFMFAVFLAKPCPFYILDEVEAALDDTNIGRFLDLIRAYSDRAQFIVITHQRRTMEAADVLYGVSMGTDGVSKVVSRRLEPDPRPAESAPSFTQAA